MKRQSTDLNTPSNTPKSTPIKTKKKPFRVLFELALFSMFGSFMFVSKVFMEFLPNIHLLGMLIMVLTVVFRAKALIPILVPLFISSFRRADELATAMECRCYHGGEGRTRMTVLHLRFSDVLALFAVAAFGAGIVLINRYFPIFSL